MRYLRMLSNSAAAACIATAYVLALVLHLNPTVPLHPIQIVSLVETVGLYYAVHLGVVCYILLVLRQLVGRELFSPAWISVGVLVWLTTMSSAAAAILMWANVKTFGRVLDAATADALNRNAAALAATSGLCLALALLRRRRPAARLAWAASLVLIAGASVAMPLVFRGPGVAPLLEARPIDVAVDMPPTERSARVTIVALDAGSLDFITGATAEGRLPNFGRILDAGAVRHLATIHPTSPEAVWAAVATGKLPQKNGVRSAGIYDLQGGGGGSLQLLPDYSFAHGLVRFGFLLERPHTSSTFRARTLWSILSMMGVSVGVVDWPLTQPAPVVRGFVVSDTYVRVAQTPSRVDDPSAVYPRDFAPDARAAMESVIGDDQAVVAASLGGASHRETPGSTDRVYDRIAQALALVQPTQVTLTRYQSLDPIGHYYLRYAMPSEFGDVTDDERRRLGSILERHYSLMDEVVGRAIAALGPDDLLLVVSGFGMEPLGLGKRLIERAIGDTDVSGSHEAAPDGFLMAYGGPAARGRQQARASVVDIAPTILYFLGLPIGRDMDGYARTDLFQPAFLDERPITYIPTYDR